MIQIIYFFMFLAPYIGSVIIFIFISIVQMSFDKGDTYIYIIGELTLNILIIPPLVSIYAYPLVFIVGCIPATLSGILYWIVLEYRVKQNLTLIKRFLTGGGIGLFISCLYFLLFSQLFDEPFINPKFNNEYYMTALFFTIIGGISSTFCASLITNKTYMQWVLKLKQGEDV